MTSRPALAAAVLLATLLAGPTAALEVETLENGLTVAVDRVPGAPGVACVVAVRAGSADDTPHAGIAHYLEHMLFKGTERYGVGAPHAAIESRGGEFNAFTAQDHTAYWIEIPREHLSVALDVLAEATLRPTFPPEEIERERTVIQEERRRRADRPDHLRWDRMSAVAFAAHPYGRPGVGTETSIAAITRGEMLAFHRTFYVPRNMLLVVSGDVEARAVVEEARRLFGAPLPDGRPVPFRPRSPEPPWTAPRTVLEPTPFARAYWTLAALGPSGRDAEANAALDVAATLLAGGEAAPLRRRLVDDLRVADEVGGWWSTSLDPDLFVLAGVSEPVDLPLVEREVRRGLARLAAAAPDPAEVDRAKAAIEASWAFENEGPRSRAFRAVFLWSIQDLGEVERYLERVRRVRPDDVRRAAGAVGPDRALFYALVPEAESGSGETTVVLPNGMRLLLRPDPSAPVASFVLGVAAGQAEEAPARAGLAPLLAEVLPRGAGGRSAEDLARAWEGAGLSVGASAEGDWIAVSAAGPPDVAGLALRAVADLALAPDLPAGEVEAARDRALGRIRAKRDDPFAIAHDRLKALALPGAYARPEAGDETTVRSIGRADLAAFHALHFVPARFTLVAEGRFDAAAVLRAVRDRFSGLAAGGGRAPAVAEGAPPRPATATIERPGAAQGLLLVGWRASAAGTREYAVMKVVNALLGGASQSRLFRHIREESGLAYAVGSFYATRRGPGLLVAYVGTDPANLRPDAPSLETAVLDALRRLRSEMTAEELEAARTKVLGDFLLDHQTSGRRAWYRAWFESIGLGAAYDERYPEAIRSVTADDVRAAIDRLLDAPRAVVRVVPPASSTR